MIALPTDVRSRYSSKLAGWPSLDGGEMIRNGISFAVDPSELSFDNYVVLFTDSALYFQWFWNAWC